MSIIKGLIMSVLVVLCLSAVPDVFAAIYKYTDKLGMINIADNLQSIPKEYRASAVLVSGEQEEEKKTAPQKPSPAQETASARVAPVPPQEQPVTDKIKKSFFNSRVLISVLVVVSALFAFVILGIIDMGHKKTVKIVRVVILWGMSVYLIVAHAGDVVNMFRTVENKVDTAQRESEEKGKKAAKALKELNTLIQNVDNPSSPGSGGSDTEKRE